MRLFFNHRSLSNDNRLDTVYVFLLLDKHEMSLLTMKYGHGNFFTDIIINAKVFSVKVISVVIMTDKILSPY